jgi:hypothetical protein
MFQNTNAPRGGVPVVWRAPSEDCQCSIALAWWVVRFRDGAGGGYGGRERAVPAADPGDVPVLPFVLGGVLVLVAGAVVAPRLRRR